MKYALPCSCGNSVPVEPGQAGQTVLCSCGERLPIPSMRAIRQLAPVREEGAARKTAPRRRWSLLRSSCFSVGLALAVGSYLWAGYVQWWRASLATDEVAWDGRLETDIELLQGMDLVEAWDAWMIVRESGIGPYNPPDYIQMRMVSDYWWDNLVIPWVIAGTVGLLLVGVALCWPRSRAPTVRRTRQ